MKKIFMLFTLLTLTISSFIPSYSHAAGIKMSDAELDSTYEVVDGDELVTNLPSTGESLTLEQLFQKYNLEPATNIPQGTEDIKFDSVETADKFFTKINKDAENPIIEDSSFSTLALGTTQVRSVSFGFSKINLYADITWNSNKIITSCRAWTTHTGVTFSLGWDQKYAYCTPTSGSRTTMVKGGGTGKWVVFVQGVGTVYSKDINIHYGYTVQ